MTTEIHRFFALQATKLMPLLNDRHRSAPGTPGWWKGSPERCDFFVGGKPSSISKMMKFYCFTIQVPSWLSFCLRLANIVQRSDLVLQESCCFGKAEIWDTHTHTENVGDDIKTSKMTNQFLAGCRCGNDFKMFCRILDRYKSEHWLNERNSQIAFSDFSKIQWSRLLGEQWLHEAPVLLVTFGSSTAFGTGSPHELIFTFH